MCEPTTIIMAASAVVSAYGAYQGAKGQKNQARYQAAVARNNAQVAEWQAKDAAERGAQGEMENRRKYARLAGAQRAALASQGLDMSEGSALALLGDTELYSTLDSTNIKANTEREVWARKNQVNDANAQAGLYQMQADNISPGMAFGATLLNSAGSVSERWYKYGQTKGG